MSRLQAGQERIYHVMGVPLRAGSFVPGNENDAQAYHDVEFIKRLEVAGWKVIDEGNVVLPSYLPHHTLPPIRNWPAPRIAWEMVGERVAPLLQQPGHVPLLIGCDCSVVVGTTQALRSAVGPDLHILYLDGHTDTTPPQADRCTSAAGMGPWFLTNVSPFWPGPPIDPSQITIIGHHDSPPADTRIRSFSMTRVRQDGPREIAQQALQAIPDSASILVHFDVDVMNKDSMPAAYFPDPEGLNTSEVRELLGPILADPRLALLEVSEYAALRDLEHTSVSSIVDLLVMGLQNQS